jgi:ATP/maltotriose-dependent transcriptional regulator MalT
MGELYFRPLVAALLAQVLFARGASEEAETFTRIADELAAQDDAELQALLRLLQAQVLAQRGSISDAIATAKEGVQILPEKETPVIRVEALLDFAKLLAAAGNAEGALNALEEAGELCRLKQMKVPAARAEALRAEVLSRTPARVP